MLLTLISVYCLTFKFVECSLKSKSTRSPSDYDDRQENSKCPKAHGLTPDKSMPVCRTLPHSFFMYHPSPTPPIFGGLLEIDSSTVTHAPDNIRTFSCIDSRNPDSPDLFYKQAKTDQRDWCRLKNPITSISMFGETILLVSEKYFARVNREDGSNIPAWIQLNELSLPGLIRENDCIVTGKLVSETMAYLLTTASLLILLTFSAMAYSSEVTELCVFKNVINFGAEGIYLAVVASEPRSLTIFQNSEGFFATQFKSILDLADTAKIVIIDQQFLLIHNESNTMLLDMTTRNMIQIPVGADTMYFENPYLLALSVYAFIKYNLNGIALQSYTFEGAVRVISDNKMEAFAVHYAKKIEYNEQIQFVTRKADREFSVEILDEIESILPLDLVHLIHEYLPDFSDELPKSTEKVFATLTFVRYRRKSDVLPVWNPKTSITDGVHTAFVKENEIYISGGELSTPKSVYRIFHPQFDFEFVAKGIIVVVEPPVEYLKFDGVDDDLPHGMFHLGITGDGGAINRHPQTKNAAKAI